MDSENDDHDKSEMHSLLVACWGIQNSILQSCRGIFIAVETFLLGIAVIVAFPGGAAPVASVSWPLGLVGIILCFVWMWTCIKRGYDDSYFRWQILKLENEKDVDRDVLSRFKEWQQKRIWQKRDQLSQDECGRRIGSSITRIVADVGLPLVYLVAWGLLFWLVYGSCISV